MISRGVGGIRFSTSLTCRGDGVVWKKYLSIFFSQKVCTYARQLEYIWNLPHHLICSAATIANKIDLAIVKTAPTGYP